MPNNVNESHLRAAIKSAQTFFQEAQEFFANQASDESGAKIRKNPFGGLEQSGESLKQESQIIDEIHRAVRGNAREVWTRNTVERLFQDALHRSLGLKGGNQDEFPKLLQTAIETLEHELRVDLYEWKIVFPIIGMRVPDDGFVMGNVTLQKSADESAARSQAILAASPHTEEEKAKLALMFSKLIEQIFKGASVAIVAVQTAEILAAKNIARQDILEIIDIFNYFSIALYPRDLRVRIHLATETPFGRHEVLAFKNDEDFNLELAREDPLREFDLTAIDIEAADKIGLSRLRSLLGKELKTEIDKSVINAARLAGKAHVAGRREDGFLLFAIAIESLVVGGNEQADLTYKLSTRCAHLLGIDLDSRKQIFKDLKELYGIRSAIAHRGKSDLPEQKLNLIRTYTLKTIKSFLTRTDLQQINTKVDLGQWFDELMLG